MQDVLVRQSIFELPTILVGDGGVGVPTTVALGRRFPSVETYVLERHGIQNVKNSLQRSKYCMDVITSGGKNR